MLILYTYIFNLQGLEYWKEIKQHFQGTGSLEYLFIIFPKTPWSYLNAEDFNP